MKEPDVTTRPRWCPRCGIRTHVTVNPYHGIGLAVHEYLSTCKRCGFVGFIPTTRSHDEVERDGALTHQGRDGIRARFTRRAEVNSRSRQLHGWARTHRVSLAIFAVLGGVFFAMLVAALLR